MCLLKLLALFLFLCAGAKYANPLTWRPCMFTDYILHVNNKGASDIQLLQRSSILQFGQLGDSPVMPHAVTFLVIVSKLDLRLYVENMEADLVNCGIHRSNTEGVHMNWPSQKSHEYNSWFTITLTHTEGLFAVSGILRHPCEPPPSGQQDVRNWPAVEDRQTLITKAGFLPLLQLWYYLTGWIIAMLTSVMVQLWLDRSGFQESSL